MKRIYQASDFETLSPKETELEIMLDYLPDNLNYMIPNGITRLTLIDIHCDREQYSKINLEMLPETLEYLDTNYLTANTIKNLPKTLKTLHCYSIIESYDDTDTDTNTNTNTNKIIIPSNITQLFFSNDNGICELLEINHPLEYLVIDSVSQYEYAYSKNMYRKCFDFIQKHKINKTYIFSCERKCHKLLNRRKFKWKYLEPTPDKITSEIFKLYYEMYQTDIEDGNTLGKIVLITRI